MQSCVAKLVDGTLPNLFQKYRKAIITGSRAELSFLGHLLYWRSSQTLQLKFFFCKYRLTNETWYGRPVRLIFVNVFASSVMPVHSVEMSMFWANPSKCCTSQATCLPMCLANCNTCNFASMQTVNCYREIITCFQWEHMFSYVKFYLKVAFDATFRFLLVLCFISLIVFYYTCFFLVSSE